MSPQTQHLYEFGPFQLDLAEQQLLQDGKPVPLTPKAFQTLLVLVENQGRIVEKNELLSRVWPDTFVEESTLAQNVFTLRKQLGDGGSETVYIETVPRRGYRFVAPVRSVDPPDKQPSVASSELLPRTVSEPHAARKTKWLSFALVVLLAVASIVYFSFSGRRQSSIPRRAMLVVLPVQNLTGDSKWEFLSDGLTEEMISHLGALNPNELGVLARTTSMVYKGAHKTVAEIGRELGVDYVIESSLRENGRLMRVTVQLIRTRDQSHIFAQDYDRSMSDLLRLQSEIAEDTARTVRLTVPDAARMKLASAMPTDPEAYDAYLKGRYYWNMRTRDGMLQSVDYYNRVLQIDPKNARAYAGLADAYNLLTFYGYASGPEVLQKGRVATLKALELDESLPEAHAAMAYGNFMWWWEWGDAERNFQRAIQLNANYLPAHQWYALHLSAMGRKEESIEQIHLARELDPKSLIVRSAAGWVYYMARQNDAAIDECTAVLAVDHNFMVAHYVLGLAYEAKRDYSRAIPEFQSAVEISGRTPMYLGALGHAYAISGRKQEAEAVLAELMARSSQQYVSPTALANVWAGLGSKAQAIEWMKQARQKDDAVLVWMRVDPRWDDLRSDPWFQDEFRRHPVPGAPLAASRSNL